VFDSALKETIMNSLVEAKVGDYLINRMHYNPYDCGTILECMRRAAQLAGHDLDEEFRFSGLGAGPEARIAAGIVDLALLGGGCETTEYAIRSEIRNWITRNPRKGRH
jgi:hypothetical protein